MTDSRFAPFCHPLIGGALGALVSLLAPSSANALTLAAGAAADFDKAIAAEGLAEPTDVAELPDGRIVVTERSGNVKTYAPGMLDPLQDHIDVDATHNERGLLAVVIDPDFATNQLVYFYASQGTDANNRQKILRYKLGTDGKLSDLAMVVDMGLMGPANHNGGGLSIYDGNIFIGVGDTGHNSTPPTNKFSSCLNHANGKVLRVSLADATLGQPVADNPLVDEAMVTGCDQSDSDFDMVAPEKRIYAWGFRNPFRVWADPMTGKLWVGDVGETTREEVDIVEKGGHYGYPFWEGTVEYNQAFKPAGACMGLTPARPCSAPGYDYARASAGSVTGGRILDGCGWPEVWKSRYVFGDHEQGKAWTVDINAARDGIVADSRQDFATTSNVVSFRMGTDNALYVVERSGTVTRVTAKAAPEATPGSCLTTNPAPTGAGGSGEGGSASGGEAGMSPGSGAVSGGGAPAGAGASGAPASGGAANPGAGTSSSSTAGVASGTPGASNGAESTDSGGCGCRLAGGPSLPPLWGLGALGSALGLVLGRRRSRPS